MAGSAFDKKKLRKVWAHVAAESSQRATAFALVERGRFVAANAALTELIGLDPVGMTWDEVFEVGLPSKSGPGKAVTPDGAPLDVWTTQADDATAVGFAAAQPSTEAPARPGPAVQAQPSGTEWGRLALDLARCTSPSEVDAVCRVRAHNLVGARGFVAVPSQSEGEVVVRCLWPVGQAAATVLAFDHTTCDALRTGEVSTACRHSQGLVCTPVFVQGRLACVVGTAASGEATELFAKLVGEALARLS